MNLIDITAATARAFETRKVSLDFDPSIYQKANALAGSALADPRGVDAHLRDTFHAHDIVFAIYPHPDHAGAFTSEVIHGAGKMARVNQGQELDLRLTAWHCPSAADAKRMRAMFSRDSHYDRERLRQSEKPGLRVSISKSPNRVPVPKALRDLAPEANANLERLLKCEAGGGDKVQWYRDLFAAHDRVILMFRDSDEPCELGYLVAKDRTVGTSGVDPVTGQSWRTTSMIVADKEQAFLLRGKMGDQVASAGVL
ncbi:hypothetical protein [Bosea sp. (in: a-proteobacteria)]|uniref:hypothetical protein n=1 Tax=Bosea sp. (in: a-proteobacteria) TaxID=1871050 RepID=UPI0027324F09|nr:hypothetical protein [Bosea sp. (in: a-proteobacteria)]MDP3408057.1 hypothetical protein [Bosea sp. (in: a-proteobacteria)]